MNEQLKETITREHPLLRTFIDWDEGEKSTANLKGEVSVTERQIADIFGTDAWPYFAVPPFMRSGWRTGVFDLEAPKTELFLAVKSLTCIGFDLREKSELFRKCSLCPSGQCPGCLYAVCCQIPKRGSEDSPRV